MSDPTRKYLRAYQRYQRALPTHPLDPVALIGSWQLFQAARHNRSRDEVVAMLSALVDHIDNPNYLPRLPADSLPF